VDEPQPLPEHLHGQPLFPHVAFRNVTMQMMWGPEPAKPLPFKCRMLQGAAAADVTPVAAAPLKDGKYEVMIPVGFPDEGTFEWLDGFLAENPDYVELSDRKILQWAASSGLWKPRAGGLKASNDKPEFSFGLTGMAQGRAQFGNSLVLNLDPPGTMRTTSLPRLRSAPATKVLLRALVCFFSRSSMTFLACCASGRGSTSRSQQCLQNL